MGEGTQRYAPQYASQHWGFLKKQACPQIEVFTIDKHHHLMRTLKL